MAPERRNMERVKKLTSTGFLALSWICLGTMTEIYGPTLIDLKERTNSSYEAVANAITGLSIGYAVGSILGGVMVDNLGSFLNLMMGLSLDVLAVATIGVPWAQRTELIWGLCFIQGVGGGILNTIGTKMIFNLWRTKAASPMCMVHGGFGIGSFLIPLIANPFLAVPMTTHRNGSEKNTTCISDVNCSFGRTVLTPVKSHTEEKLYLKPSRIEIAYLIPSVISICLSTVFYAYQFIAKKEKQKVELRLQKSSQNKSLNFKEMLNPGSRPGTSFVDISQTFR